MADTARRWTNEELAKIEDEIRGIYSEAKKGITQKWNAYMKRNQRHLAALYNSIETKEDLEKYQRELMLYTLQNQKYQEMIAETTRRITNANQIAVDYMNGKMPPIYAVNYNQAANDAATLGIRFNIINEDVIRRRIIEGDIKLPNKALDIPKDMRWNTKQLNASVVQGIIQGESMDKIAKRIYPVVGKNQAAAIRNARTMVTGAENAGRHDSYTTLEANGVILEKEWLSAHDGRTRDWHTTLDGQSVANDEPFIDGNGNELMYPGDPDADPETVYNCRCSMRANIKGFIPKSRRVN